MRTKGRETILEIPRLCSSSRCSLRSHRLVHALDDTFRLSIPASVPSDPGIALYGKGIPAYSSSPNAKLRFCPRTYQFAHVEVGYEEGLT